MELIQFETGFKLNTKTMKYYCTIGFYTLLPLDLWFERYEFCKFQQFKTI
jgi:hypothetical protein